MVLPGQVHGNVVVVNFNCIDPCVDTGLVLPCWDWYSKSICISSATATFLELLLLSLLTSTVLIPVDSACGLTWPSSWKCFVFVVVNFHCIDPSVDIGLVLLCWDWYSILSVVLLSSS